MASARRPGSGVRSLRTRSWARGRLTVAPGHREPQGAQTQILAGRAPLPGRRAAAEELHGRAPRPSACHLHIQRSVSLSGRRCLQPRCSPGPIFPESVTPPTAVTTRIQHSEKKGWGDTSSWGWAPGDARKACASRRALPRTLPRAPCQVHGDAGHGGRGGREHQRKRNWPHPWLWSPRVN